MLLAMRATTTATACLLPLLICGCGHAARMTLRQPFAPNAQRHMTLVSDRAYGDRREGRGVCLLEFPRPGARTSRDFLLYVDVPAANGEWEFDSGDPNGARGFLIQEVGDLRGKTMLKSGRVRLRSVWWSSTRRRIDLAATSEDGATIEVAGVLREAPSHMSGFKRRHSADIALLEAASGDVEHAADATGARLNTDE